jgi:hypothetical protein
MCGSEEEPQGADAIQIPRVASHTRSVQEEAETGCRQPVKKGW